MIGGTVVVLAGIVMVAPIMVATLAALIFTPIAAGKTWLFESTSSFPQFFRDRSALVSEINTLHSDLAAAGGNRFTIDALARENEELRRLLGDEGETRILAGIIGRPSALPYDTLMLDRGSKDGIVVDAPVFIGDNTIIGIVRYVAADSSVVELITTPGFETTVFIIGPDIFTHASGIGGGQMRVGVPQGIALTEGDLVVIPSITSGVYGAITHVESAPTQPEQYGYVSTHIPIASMRLVAVGSTPVTPVSFEEAQEILAAEREALLMISVPDDVLIGIEEEASETETELETGAEVEVESELEAEPEVTVPDTDLPPPLTEPEADSTDEETMTL